MKRLIAGLCFVLFWGTAVSADVTLYGNHGTKLSLSGEVTGRVEYWNFFEPAGPFNNDYFYEFTRTKLGVKFESNHLDAFLQLQNVNMFGLPDDAIAPPPQGVLGGGAIYFIHDREENPSSTYIRQANVKLKFAPFTLKAGRLTFFDGEEVLYKDDRKMNWLKKVRISERLIGPFGWSSFQRSFDGGVGTYDSASVNVTAAAFHPTQGGFEKNGQTEIREIDAAYLALTLKKGVVPYSDTRLFYIYYEDDRGLTKADNQPAGSPLDRGDIRINTLGFHLASVYRPSEKGEMDLILWGAVQRGTWGSLDQKSWAWNAELGYQFLDVPLKPWVRAGYFVSSGDDNPNDNDHGTFFQLLPTVRKQSNTPAYYNYMNIEDLFAMLILKPSPKTTVKLDLNFVGLNNSRDRWYFGSGATSRSVFGFTGRPSQGEDNIGTMAGGHFFYNLSRNLSLYFYYSHMWGGDVVKKTFPDGSEGDYSFLELTFKF
ncbi:MAG: alginate export family protein [Candidatus Sulfobium sp.]|jgi:hypothetical protein